MQTYLLTAQMDTRAGQGKIASRIGIGEEADTFTTQDDLFEKIQNRLAQGPVACAFIDEAQFLTKEQVWALARVVDDLGLPVMCYGLRVIFWGSCFRGPPRFWRWLMKCARYGPSAIAARRRQWWCDLTALAKPSRPAIKCR